MHFRVVETLVKPSYPFPSLNNNNAEPIKEWTDNLVKNEYTFLPDKMRAKYILSNFGYITARCLPHIVNFEQVLPCARFMLWGTVLDDYYEFYKEDQLDKLKNGVVDILRGKNPTREDHFFFHEAKVIRDELSAFMPSNWMSRFTENVQIYLKSMQWEVPYKKANNFPCLKDFIRLREITIGVQAFLDLIDIQIGHVLPDEIYKHPYIQELYRLTARIFAWCNDFYSVEKDIGREPLNLVLVMQHEYGLSLSDANMEALKLHDRDVAALIVLQDAVPDFGIHSEDVKLFAWYLGVMIQGQAQWYEVDTKRYKKGGHPDLDTFKNMSMQKD